MCNHYTNIFLDPKYIHINRYIIVILLKNFPISKGTKYNVKMHTGGSQKDKIENHEPLLVTQLFQVQMLTLYLKIVIGVANLNSNLQDQKIFGGPLK